jgi:hypothetical protein
MFNEVKIFVVVCALVRPSEKGKCSTTNGYCNPAVRYVMYTQKILCLF